ncbi:MAG: glycosyltransferase, partial [Nitrospinaceae bacterium]
LSFVHQTGGADAAFVKAGYERRGFAADVAPFLFDVEARYREADLVICRAGATTLAELTALGKPAVLIPFPYATHNHQEKNARVLEAAGAAVVLLDREMDGKKLGAWIRDALEHPDAWNDRVQASYQLGRRDATERVRRLCLDLMDRAAA